MFDVIVYITLDSSIITFNNQKANFKGTPVIQCQLFITAKIAEFVHLKVQVAKILIKSANSKFSIWI